MRSLTVTQTVLTTALILAPMYLCSDRVLAQSRAFTITPVVKRGDPSPDGGRFFGCDDCGGRINGSHAFNNLGHTAFAAETEGRCFDALFLITGPGSTVLSDPCTETRFGKLGFGDANINALGQAAFKAFPLTGSSIFLHSDGNLDRIVAEGDPTPVGTVFRGCGFSEPSINSRGEIAFGACSDADRQVFRDGVFLYSGGVIRKVVLSHDPSPIGGEFLLNFFPAVDGLLNDNGDVLFQAGVIIDGVLREKFGLFLATPGGFQKVVVDGDQMPDGTVVSPGTLGIGDLNNRGEVAFTVALSGKSDTGVFVSSGGVVTKIMAEGDPTPIGGTFATLEDPELFDKAIFIRPRINDNSAVAFIAKVSNGSSRLAIFLASPKAMLKVVAVGDQLPSGETIREINSFALNDLGQVAFFAYGKKGKQNPLGVYAATPETPQIKSIKVKRRKGSLELRVNGKGMIVNDSVIEINGVPLGEMDYPADFREDGGTITRVISRDPRLEQLLAEGQTVQVTINNSLTNKRSAATALIR